jgi:NAD+ kinase
MEFAADLTNVIEKAGAEVVGTGAAADGEAPDMVLAVGGDGTMLAAVRLALAYDVPVLGFNLGTLGFLTEAEPGDLEKVIARILEGDYTTEDRMTVTATVDGVAASGVNDVVVEKLDSQRLVALAVSIDGAEFMTYRADGLIVATPTGSTAYAFSAGGPLVDPSLDALILTPVASHSLFDRAMVLPADSEIEVRVALDRSIHVTVDKNDLGHLAGGELVMIQRGDQRARFVTLDRRPFAGLVKSKFALS